MCCSFLQVGKSSSRTRAQGDHEEELQELQRRFNALSEQRRTAEGALLTKDLFAPEESRHTSRHMSDQAAASEIPKLDDQIVELRRKHDRLHDSNHRKRQDLNVLVDKLKEIHSTKFKTEDTLEHRLRSGEAKLAECASK